MHVRPRAGHADAPQGVVQIAPQWSASKPLLVALPSYGGLAMLGGRTLTFANDSKIACGAYTFPGSNGYVDLGSGNVTPTTVHTMLLVTQCDAIGSSQFAIAADYNASGKRYTAFFSNYTGYTDVGLGERNTGSSGPRTQQFALTSVGVLGTRHSFVARHTGSGMDAWRDGRKLSPASNNPYGSSSGNSVLGQASPSSLSNDFVGRIWVFALFNSLLTDFECEILSADPWSLFAPPRILMPRAGAAYTHPTLSNARMVSGVYPAVDYTW